MPQPPVYNIDPRAFWDDPYPDLKAMRRDAPVAFVPQLGAVLMTRRDDIFTCEKNIAVFSSWQPGGLMTKLMGENMMRKDGEAHQSERKAIFPSVSPKTVKEHWKAAFERETDHILDDLAPRRQADLLHDFAMPVSAEALKSVTGLTNMHFAEMNRVSQGMIDGCANYGGDPAVEARCHDCTASIDTHIDAMKEQAERASDYSLLTVQMKAGMSDAQLRANIKLAISGGQNEPRDAIAGTAWALLAHPRQLQLIRDGKATWLQAFEEYARWQSPIGMSPRRIAQHYQWNGIALEPEQRLFFMFGSANRDERIFEQADDFDITRNLQQSIPFGAGPHYCAGAWVSRCLIAEVALPKLFARLPGLRLADGAQVPFGGWAFRGPLRVDVVW
ncbi:MAG: cytochrome P450 [Alphaproteobacteria bacterium]|nr:cytochrome P450 [Alphaproteobacteria bacterium]